MPGLDVGERREEEHDQRRVPVDERLSALESDVLALRDEVARLNAARERQGLEPPSLEPHAKRLRLASPRLVLQPLQQAKLKAAALLVPAPMGEWAPGGRVWDALAVALLLLIAIPLRFVHLGSVPFGFHGDEAAVGLEAQRILQRGWIGPYSGEAGGTPAGPYYAAAVAIHFLGNTVFAARFASAVFDTLTVVLVYVLARRNFGWGSAVIAGLLTAVSIWQLEFARLAFINSAWPFCVVAGAAALCEAIRTRSPVWWAAAGALAASGLYAYPAHALFLGVLALFLLIHFAGLFGVVALGAFAAAYLAGGPVGFAALTAGAAALALNRRLRNRTVLKEAAAFCVSFVVVAWPIIQFARKNRETFFRTGRGVSVFEDEKWSSMHGAGARAWWLVGRYFEFWDRAVRHPVQDGIDGTGAAPLIPSLFAVLCVVGLWLAWQRRSQPLVLIGGLVVVLMPLAVATSNNFPLRRAAAITPFMAIFAAVAMVEFIRSTWRKGFFVRFAALLLVLVVSGQVVYRDLDGYFNKTAASPGMYWTLAGDLVNSVDFMKTLPRDSYVYFYAERWPFDSGERLFLAPEVQGESRGQEFGDHSLALDPANGRPVVVLIGKYEALLPVFQMMHPNGSFDYGPPVPGTNGEPSFIAFFPGVDGP